MIDVKTDMSFNCVICDFGFANFIGNGGDGKESDQHSMAKGMRIPTTNGISIRYAAPEVTLFINEIFSHLM